MRLDISVLHQRQLDWGDPIPNELKRVWEDNSDVIRELGNIQFKRAVVPDDAVNLDMRQLIQLMQAKTSFVRRYTRDLSGKTRTIHSNLYFLEQK